MQNVLRIFIVLVLVVLPLGLMLFAQPIGGPPPCWPPPCIPIDGGVGLLAVAGALLGGRKALELRRTSNHNE